jgi:hypothetical protein
VDDAPLERDASSNPRDEMEEDHAALAAQRMRFSLHGGLLQAELLPLLMLFVLLDFRSRNSGEGRQRFIGGADGLTCRLLLLVRPAVCLQSMGSGGCANVRSS